MKRAHKQRFLTELQWRNLNVEHFLRFWCRKIQGSKRGQAR